MTPPMRVQYRTILHGSFADAKVKKIFKNANNVRQEDRPEEKEWVPMGPANVDGISANSYPYRNATPGDPFTLIVVRMDPWLPTITPAHSLWAALESLIVHAPKGECVLLQTSACNKIPGNNGADGETGARATLGEIFLKLV